jgi:PII-like signaling protein
MAMSKNATLLRIYTDETAFFGDQRVYRVIADRARESGLGGATVLQALYGFRGRAHVHAKRLLEDDQSVVIEIVDEEAKLRSFVSSLTDIPDVGLVTLEQVEVLRGPPSDAGA